MRKINGIAVKKDFQLNVRFTAEEIRMLDEIAEIEDRDRSYLVAFFTRWGMQQYRRVGSLVVLRKKSFPEDRRVGDIDAGAVSRLKLRTEAKDAEESGGETAATSKRAR